MQSGARHTVAIGAPKPHKKDNRMGPRVTTFSATAGAHTSVSVRAHSCTADAFRSGRMPPPTQSTTTLPIR